MNLKKRFMISNTVTILIPFIITIIVGICFILISSIIFDKDMSYNNFKRLTMIKAELFSVANNISEQKTQEALDTEFQQYLSQRLMSLKGEFIIIKDDQVSFASNDINKIDIERTLEEVKTQGLQKTLKINNKSYFVQDTGIMLKDGT
jgi:sensor histidine kinase regulating citrate/malate metabolism